MFFLSNRSSFSTIAVVIFFTASVCHAIDADHNDPAVALGSIEQHFKQLADAVRRRKSGAEMLKKQLIKEINIVNQHIPEHFTQGRKALTDLATLADPAVLGAFIKNPTHGKKNQEQWDTGMGKIYVVIAGLKKYVQHEDDESVTKQSVAKAVEQLERVLKCVVEKTGKKIAGLKPLSRGAPVTIVEPVTMAAMQMSDAVHQRDDKAVVAVPAPAPEVENPVAATPTEIEPMQPSAEIVLMPTITIEETVQPDVSTSTAQTITVEPVPTLTEATTSTPPLSSLSTPPDSTSSTPTPARAEPTMPILSATTATSTHMPTIATSLPTPAPTSFLDSMRSWWARFSSSIANVFRR